MSKDKIQEIKITADWSIFEREKLKLLNWLTDLGAKNLVIEILPEKEKKNGN